LPSGPPYACAELHAWAGLAFELPPGDPRLASIHRGGPAPTPPLDNLVGAVRAWREHPEWMEFLDPEAPNHLDKLTERSLYLARWAPYIAPGARVLDLGGGVGRFTTWLLDHGCEVEIVDPDLRSLWRCLSAAVGRPGSLDVHWSTGELLPELEPVDVVVACEVLCYAEDPRRVVERLQAALRPGGVLLASVEARYGWAMGPDAPPDTLEAFLEDGIVHVPGDRWIRTCTEQMFRSWLAPLEIRELIASHYALSGPFEAASRPRDLEETLLLEARLREHPIAGPCNRAWMAVAHRG
jgi:SAM-dependent methyltransferase